jgi:hypothetical protein
MLAAIHYAASVEKEFNGIPRGPYRNMSGVSNARKRGAGMFAVPVGVLCQRNVDQSPR